MLLTFHKEWCIICYSFKTVQFSRLDYEVRNKKKEKKEKAAFAAYIKAKAEGRFDIQPIKVEWPSKSSFRNYSCPIGKTWQNSCKNCLIMSYHLLLHTWTHFQWFSVCCGEGALCVKGTDKFRLSTRNSPSWEEEE